MLLLAVSSCHRAAPTDRRRRQYTGDEPGCSYLVFPVLPDNAAPGRCPLISVIHISSIAKSLALCHVKRGALPGILDRVSSPRRHRFDDAIGAGLFENSDAP